MLAFEEASACKSAGTRQQPQINGRGRRAPPAQKTPPQRRGCPAAGAAGSPAPAPGTSTLHFASPLLQGSVRLLGPRCSARLWDRTRGRLGWTPTASCGWGECPWGPRGGEDGGNPRPQASFEHLKAFCSHPQGAKKSPEPSAWESPRPAGQQAARSPPHGLETEEYLPAPLSRARGGS